MGIVFDARFSKPKCSPSSQPCGKTCIPKEYTCKGDRLPVSPEAKKALARIEDEIRNEPIEHLILLDPQTGKERLRATGDQTSVSVSPRDFSKFKGSILTHNHPNVGNWPPDDPRSKGFAFSYADINTATSLGVREIRAVATGYNHSMIMPNRKINVRGAVYKHHWGTYRSIQREVLTGKLDRRSADQEYWHRIWTKVAADHSGMTYTRTEVGREDSSVAVSEKEARSLVATILRRSYGKDIRGIRIKKIEDGKISGLISDRTRVVEFLITDKEVSTRMKRSLVGRRDGESVAVGYELPLTEEVERMDKKESGPKGIRCGRGWISSRKVCRVSLNSITSPSERRQLALVMSTPAASQGGGTGIEDNPASTIRELQKEARDQGIPYANRMTKSQLRDTIRAYKSSPKAREATYKALSKKKKAEDTITNSQFAKDWKTANKILKLAGSGGVVSGVAVAAILANRTTQEIERAQNSYAENFASGARRAKAKGQLLAQSAEPLDAAQHQALFIVGGASAEEGRAEDIQAQLRRYAREEEEQQGNDYRQGGATASSSYNYPFSGYLNNPQVTRQYLFNPTKTDFDFEGETSDRRGRYTPQYLARLGVEGVGLGRPDLGIKSRIVQAATGSAKNSGNEDAIDLAAQIYAHVNAVRPAAVSLSSLRVPDLNEEIAAMNRNMPSDAQFQSLGRRASEADQARAREWLRQMGWTGSRMPNKQKPVRIIAYGHGSRAVKEAMELIHAMGDPDRQMLNQIDIAYISSPDFNFTKERARREASFVASNDPYAKWNHRNPERFTGATTSRPRSIDSYFQSPSFRSEMAQWMGYRAWSEQQRTIADQERASRRERPSRGRRTGSRARGNSQGQSQGQSQSQQVPATAGT